MEKQYDVLIIGGGPAGAAAAITLCRYTPFRVAVIERSVFDDYRAGESVSPSIFPLLSYLGLLREQLDPVHLPSYAHAAAWGNDQLIVRDLLFSGQGNGMHLDRKKFDELLLNTARICGATVFQPAQVTDISRDENWQVKLFAKEQEIILSARYVIDCSGKHAMAVKKQQCPVHKEDNLVALYAYYTTGDDLVVPHRTVLETAEHGWYYLTPLPGKKVAIACITDADILKAYDLNDPEHWLEKGMATKHISPILARLTTPEIFRHYAIHSRVALLPGNENWTAAGDAASCFDPVSALGIGHAINSGINSARVAEAFFKGDYQPGVLYSRFLLEHFETYLRMRHGFYAAEQRWKDAPFWQRRSVVKVGVS